MLHTLNEMINITEEMGLISDPEEWRKEAAKYSYKIGSYESHQLSDTFHGSPALDVDCKAYFANFPFKFALNEEKMVEAPVVLPPWNKPPKQLRKILKKIGCSTKAQKVPKIDCEGTLQRMCVSNAETMVAKCGGSVVFGYSVFQGAKHWYLERHAVYKSPDGELQDPTPSIYGYCVEPYTCFVECLVEFEHVGCVNMGQAHTVGMDKQELRRNKRNGWHGETIYMESHNTAKNK